MRKRTGLHLLFWIVYLFQDVLLHFTWMGPYLPGTAEYAQIWMAVKTAFLTLPPKVILVYYFLYVGGRKLLNEKVSKTLAILEMAGIICLCLAIFRIIFYYFITPKIYLIPLNGQPLFTLRSTLISILELGFVTGVAIALKSLRMQLSGKEREKSLVKEKLETELKFLRNQMNPHFLMNTLNNIYALARRKSDDTAEVVMKLSELLRFILYESAGQYISLSDELRVIEDYLDLESIRYNKRLSVTFTKTIDSNSYQITPLLLLAFVENAFKHGISESRFESFVRIDVRVNAGYLEFQIENTNENESLTVPLNNIGLNNVRRQLQLTYSEYDLDIKNGNNIFTVNLRINLNTHVKI